MATWLKQSTAVDIAMGPFLDETDGKTAETGLTITQPDIRLKKNGGNWAQKSASQTLSHEEAGWYEVSLSTTDTDTLGILIVAIHESGALPVWREFMVVPANVYDSLIGGSDALQVHANEITAGLITATAIADNAITANKIASDAIANAKIADGAITAAKIATGAITNAKFAAGAIDAAAIAPDAIGASELAADAVAEIQNGLATAAALATAQADLDTLTGADGAVLATSQPNYAPAVAGDIPTVEEIRAEIDANSTQLAAIVGDTNELQTDWANGGRLDNILDARASQTSVDDLPTNAELAAALADADDATLAAIATVDGKVDDIKTVTDNLPDAGALTSPLPANLKQIRDIDLVGDGQPGTEFSV